MLVHVVLATAVRPMTRMVGTFIGSTYGLVGLCAIVVALIRDPYLDPDCWANCTTNLFEVSSRPELARQVANVQRWITAAIALALTITCVVKQAKTFGVGLRRSWEVLPGGSLVGGATMAYMVLLQRQPLEDPGEPGYASVFFIRCGAVVVIAVGLGGALLQARRQRRSVARIVATMDQAPPVGALDSALAIAVGDPSLRISYWLPAVGNYADAHGRHVPDPSADASVTATPVVRSGETVAVVTHRTDPIELERAFGSAARLALDNERLQADVQVRMQDLAESRARIVEAADERRRSLERDLHDGAQQSLLGLSYDLRLALSTADAGGDQELAEVFDSAITDVREAFGELRQLAHGIFPAALTAAGLCPAVFSLADSASVNVDVDCALDERHPPAVETAGYVVVAAGLQAAVDCGAQRVAVTIGRRANLLVVEVTHGGTNDPPDMLHVADRVGAAGGTLVVEERRITAEIPCAS